MRETSFAIAFLMMVVAGAGSALAAGDAKIGKKRFAKCKACHSVSKGVNKVGPSLNCVVSRKAGTAPKFKYSKDFKAAAATDFNWTEDKIFAYLADPKGYIGALIGKKTANIRMFNKFPKKDFRENVIAYLKTRCK